MKNRRDKLRVIVGERDGWKCHYCDAPLTKPSAESSRDPRDLGFATLDRKNPGHRGGKYRPENLLLACRTCNESKRHTRYEDYMALKD